MSDDENTGVPPIEIPWQLGGTTRVSTGDAKPGYAGSTVSLFYYEPQLEEEIYPGSRLVYFRFSVSLQPRLKMTDRLRDMGFSDPEMCQFLDRRTVTPIKHMILDLRIEAGDTKPYFVAAAPACRQMIEDAERGMQHLEGTSESLGIGKSGSTLHEAFSSATTVSSDGWSVAGPIGVGGQDTTTTMSGTRDTTQSIDVTNRNAASERRDLLSHTTRITNILSLLNVYHVGSSVLRWRLSPPPITAVPAAPDDPYATYAELLRLRSSGLEGTQDFYAVAVVPKATGDLFDYCVYATLTEVGVFQAAGPPDPEPMSLGTGHWQDFADEAVRYLRWRYPPGTSIDEIADLDLRETAIVVYDKVGGSTGVVALDNVRAATIYDWWPSRPANKLTEAQNDLRTTIDCGIVGALTRAFKDDATNHASGDTVNGWATYKPLVAAVLEARQDEARRHLLLGVDTEAVVVRKTDLSWCRNKPIIIGNYPLFLLEMAASPQQFTASAASSRGMRKALSGAQRTQATLAAAERDLSALVAGLDDSMLVPFGLHRPGVQRVLLAALSTLDARDPANQPLEQAARYGLDLATIEQLRRTGVADFRRLAVELLRDDSDRLHQTVQPAITAAADPAQRTRPAPDPAAQPRITAETATQTRRLLTEGLRRLRPGGA